MTAASYSRTTRPKPGPRAWFIAMRPWSLTAAAVPVCVGASLAALHGGWNTGLFLLTLAGGIFLQLGTNLHNTYGDYKSGVDTVESAVTCPQLVTGAMDPFAMYKAGWICFGLAALTGVALTIFCGLWVLVFGGIGVAGGYYYTNGKLPYKYAGLGPYGVFFLMGPLMVFPAYVILTGKASPAPVLASLSVACLVSAIMHANDMRDIGHDNGAGIKTVAMAMGLKKSVTAYAALNLGAFAVLAVNVAIGVLPKTALIVFVLLPPLLRVLRGLHTGAFAVGRLEGWAAGFHFQFGLLLAVTTALPLLSGIRAISL